MLPYCGRTICISWQKPKNAICRSLKRRCMQLVRSLIVNVLRRRFLNSLSNLSEIFGYCSQNLLRRVANKSFSFLNIHVFVQVLTSYYCVSSAGMLNIRCQNQLMVWVTGGRRIRHCLYKNSSKPLMILTKIFAVVPINNHSVLAGVIVKSQSQI